MIVATLMVLNPLKLQSLSLNPYRKWYQNVKILDDLQNCLEIDDKPKQCKYHLKLL